MSLCFSSKKSSREVATGGRANRRRPSLGKSEAQESSDGKEVEAQILVRMVLETEAEKIGVGGEVAVQEIGKGGRRFRRQKPTAGTSGTGRRRLRRPPHRGRF